MAVLSIEQLTKKVSRDGALQLLLTELQSLGFNATSWQPGSIARTLVEVFAAVYSSASGVVAEIAAAGFNETAVGGWLDLLSLSHYNHSRKPAVATRGFVRLDATAQAPPFSIGVGDLVFADEVSGRTYRNVSSGILNAGGALELEVEAEVAGAAGDVGTGAIRVLKTPLVGVSVTNPLRANGASWISRAGADVESDEALRERNRSRWSTLGVVGVPGRAYGYYALAADETVRRVFVDDQNPDGPGTVGVYVAGDAGPISVETVAAVQGYLNGSVDGVQRTATGSVVNVKSATPRGVTVRATVYLVSPYQTTATQAAVRDALRGYFRSLPVGGTSVAVGEPGAVVFGELYRAALTVPGVRNVAFQTPLADVPLQPREVAVPILQLSYVTV